jgi:hypothetical protein
MSNPFAYPSAPHVRRHGPQGYSQFDPAPARRGKKKRS